MLSTIKQNINNLEWWKSVVGSQARKARNKAVYKYYQLSGVDMVENVQSRDWDNLIILDACRYDVFEQIYSEFDFDGKLSAKYSSEPMTRKFLQTNFGDDVLHDTVIITGNPNQKRTLDDDQFHAVYHVWDTHWSNEINSVHPKSINKVAREAKEKHPKKRLILWYMQPHKPFIGPWAAENLGIGPGFKTTRKLVLNGGHDIDTSNNPYYQLQRGEISDQDIKKAYTENLEIALDYIKGIVRDLDGKTVISGDHGELFGERPPLSLLRYYEHPNIITKTSLEIPYLVIEDSRREIKSDPPKTTDDIRQGDKIEEKLRHLGYKS